MAKGPNNKLDKYQSENEKEKFLHKKIRWGKREKRVLVMLFYSTMIHSNSKL